MSRTRRKLRKGYKPQRIEEGGDAQIDNWLISRKMKPYTRPNLYKLKATKTDHVPGFAKGVSKSDKLITRNANRSFKKGYRQELEKQLKKELNEVDIHE